MAERKLSYIAVGFLPQDLENKFSEIRAKVGLPSEIPTIQQDGTCNLIGKPHITLKRTFYLNDGVEESELIKRMQEIEFNGIQISADSWQVFDTSHLGKVVVIKINKVSELAALHNDLVDAADGISHAKNPEYERAGFEPHASVVYWAADNNLEILGNLINDCLPIEYTLSEVHLFRKDLDKKEAPDGPDVRELVAIFKSKE